MTDREEVEAAVVEAHRREWGLVLAATVRVARDLDLAEECVQEAYAAALEGWTDDGIPANPAAWLTTAAKRRAIDAIRRDHSLRAKLPLLIEPEDSVEDTAMNELQDELQTKSELPAANVPDERLRLIFLCCHPALAQPAQMALALRLVCGLSTPDIARALLVSESTMAARITRAKRKIVGSRIPYRMPRVDELPDRVRAVLGVIHLLFTTGHTAPSGTSLVRGDLVDNALHLARMLHELMPDETEATGLLALLLVTDARRATRLDDAGRLLTLAEQDHNQWDQVAIGHAHDLIMEALGSGPAGRYTVPAAIAALYAQAPSFEQTDWPQILTLYDRLLAIWPSPVVALNRTVPLSHVDGPAAALAEIETLDGVPELAGYHYLPAIKGDLLARLGRTTEAAEAYRHALNRADNSAEREFLTRQITSLH